MSVKVFKEGYVQKAKEAMLSAVSSTKKWCSENKEIVIALGPSMIGFGVELIKMAVKKGYLNEERRLKNNYIYDRDHGHFYELCRKPSSSEWITIDHGRDLDIPLNVILSNLDLLKK